VPQRQPPDALVAAKRIQGVCGGDGSLRERGGSGSVRRARGGGSQRHAGRRLIGDTRPRVALAGVPPPAMTATFPRHERRR
jgi:hypothetical protein